MGNKSNKRLYFTIILILILAYMPLMGAIDQKTYMNFTSFSDTFFTSSGGYTKLEDGYIILGDLKSENTSWGTWNLVMRTLPFMTQEMKHVTDAYVLIPKSFPATNERPVRTHAHTHSVWRDDTFTTGWFPDQYGSTNYSFTSDGDIATISGTFSANTAGSVWIRRHVPAISTNTYPFLVFRVYVEDGINSNWLVEIHYTDGSLEGWYGYNVAWRTFTKMLTSGKTVSNINVRVENNRAATWVGYGTQYAYFDYIALGSDLSAKSIRVTLNGNPILYNGLTFEKDGLFTLPPPYDSNVRIDIPLDEIKIENLLNITVDSKVSWKIYSIHLFLHTQISSLHPVWTQFVPHIFLIFALELVGTYYILHNKLHKWLRSLCLNREN